MNVGVGRGTNQTSGRGIEGPVIDTTGKCEEDEKWERVIRVWLSWTSVGNKGESMINEQQRIARRLVRCYRPAS